MIIMTNTMCRNGYCDYGRNESEIVGSNVNDGNSHFISGVFILAAVAVLGIAAYGITHGIYIDPTYLN